MSEIPELTNYGYRVVQELGRNRDGGRITWQGIDLNSQKNVIIKQFCFAQTNSSWLGYRVYLNEIEILKSLEHPRIPSHLNSVETENGFCLIQEYIPAIECDLAEQLDLDQVKQISLQSLDILIYLQQLSCPVVHCDIRPDNILLDKSLTPYLINFGLARRDNEEISADCLLQNLSGFVAPEQITQPCAATDLYGLGLILVCLLTSKTIDQVRSSCLSDDPFQLNLTELLPDLDSEFRQWLESMVAAQVDKRFPDAFTAKHALLNIDWTPSSSQLAVVEPKSLLKLVSQPQVLAGAFGMAGLSSIVVWSINFASRHVDLSIINLAIACLSAIAITTAQFGGIAIAKLDNHSRPVGALMNIGVPLLLVLASSLIWGQSEAVLIATAITITETFLLTYCWWRLPSWHANVLLRNSLSLCFIILGLVLGFTMI